MSMAIAINNWVRQYHLLPGDRITLTYDGEHADVAITDMHNAYFHDDDLKRTIEQLQEQ